MKLLLGLFLLVGFVEAQATFVPGTPATAAKAAVFNITVASGTTNAINCTITGNTFPATSVTVSNCVAGTVTIPNFTIPNTVTLPWALTMQVNSGANAATFILQVTATSPNFVISATVNGGTPVVGTF